MVNRVIAGSLKELNQEEIQTIEFWVEQHPVSLAYNNIQVKKMLKELRPSVSRGN